MDCMGTACDARRIDRVSAEPWSFSYVQGNSNGKEGQLQNTLAAIRLCLEMMAG